MKEKISSSIICSVLGICILFSSVNVLHAQTAIVTDQIIYPPSLQVLRSILRNLQDELTKLSHVQLTGTIAATVTPSANLNAYDIIIVAGQSNAVGVGAGTYKEDPQLMVATNTAKVFQLGRFGDHNMKIIPVTHEPLEFWDREETYSTTSNGRRGSAYPFALRLAANQTTGRNVLIIPAAQGGTSLLRWDKVVNNFPSGNPDSTLLYDDMVSRVKYVLAENPENRVVAVIWRQGEADVTTLTTKESPYRDFMSTTTYQTKLATFRSNLRQDLNNQGCIPFLYGEMTQQWIPSETSSSTVVSSLRVKKAITNAIKYVASNDPCNKSVFIPSDNTTVNTNPVHFNAAGQWEMAKRFWAAYKNI